jgi:putative intracellular protease/amidase/YHS domain-containing protein
MNTTRLGATRRDLLKSSAVLAPLVAVGSTAMAQTGAGASPSSQNVAGIKPIPLPADGKIPVAFPISAGAVLIDLAGPWEVFLNAAMIGPGGSMDMSGDHGFQPFTVAETRDPVETYGGMKITPTHTFDDAPSPRLIVIPAQGGDSEAMLRWIRQAAKGADLTMSICTGAFTLAKTGLLAGKAATTHHGAYAELAMRFPDIHVKRGYRFVDEGAVASSGGLTCGIDLAFHVVERYFGRERALTTALNMEYQGKGWMDATGADNAVYASAPTGPACPVCGMSVAATSPFSSVFDGRAYVFCNAAHKALFDKDPRAILRLAASSA